LKILVSAADKASSAGFWAHFNIVTYYYYYYYRTAPFSMTLKDPIPRFQGQAIL